MPELSFDMKDLIEIQSKVLEDVTANQAKLQVLERARADVEVLGNAIMETDLAQRVAVKDYCHEYIEMSFKAERSLTAFHINRYFIAKAMLDVMKDHQHKIRRMRQADSQLWGRLQGRTLRFLHIQDGRRKVLIRDFLYESDRISNVLRGFHNSTSKLEASLTFLRSTFTNVEPIMASQVGDLKQQISHKGLLGYFTRGRRLLVEQLDTLKGHSKEVSRIRIEIVTLLKAVEEGADWMDKEATRLRDYRWQSLFISTESSLDLAELDARMTKTIAMMEQALNGGVSTSKEVAKRSLGW